MCPEHFIGEEAGVSLLYTPTNVDSAYSIDNSNFIQIGISSHCSATTEPILVMTVADFCSLDFCRFDKSNYTSFALHEPSVDP